MRFNEDPRFKGDSGEGNPERPIYVENQSGEDDLGPDDIGGPPNDPHDLDEK